jgi:hypothetical protein
MQKALNGMAAVHEDAAAYQEAMRRIRLNTLRRSVLEEYQELVRRAPTPDKETRP